METKRQSFLARVAMTLLLTVLTTVTAWAAEWPEYVTDIIVVGGSESEVNSAKSYNSGYTWCSMDLNKGAGGDYIYFGYKKSRTANTNGGYITDIIVIDAEGTNPPSTVTCEGRTYYLCSYDGGSHFEGVKGNLNSNCGKGWNIYLYYTKQEYSSTKRAVSSIDVNSTKAGSINCYYKSGSKEEEQIDLNRGISGSSDVYMHLSTATKVNRPYPEPSMASNLVYDGQPKQLISSSYSNSNSGTLYYRVGTTGNYTSTVADVTATAAGTHTVYYYSASSSYGNSSENYAHSQTVNIAKSANSGATVVCADGLESVAPSPTVSGTNLSTGDITYLYNTSQNGTYTTDVPNTAGTYWVKATIAADGNCNAYTTPAVSFKLKPDWAVHHSGTTEADAYVISTTEDLNLLASRVNAGNTYQNKFFKLNASLTYDGTANNFTPIGTKTCPFMGTFDGNGKTISGLNINLGSNEYVGLFGYADNNATIKNLKLTNSTISGNSNVGAILGCGSSSYPNHTNVENCEVASDVNVSGSASAVGGITGAVANVRGCVSAASVSGFSNIGGIVGNSNGITISQCLYTGTSISSGAIYKGAITGKLDETTTILIANYYTADLDCKAVTNSNDIDGARKAIDINTADGVTVTPTGDATVYNVSGITAYASNNGIRYNGQLYAGATERVRLTVGYTAPADFVFNGYTDGHDNALTANDDDTYTLTMTAEAATVTPDGVSLWGIASGADGSQAHPYVITTPAGLDLLASNVNGGKSYQYAYFVLGNDIAYSYAGLAEGESNYTAIGKYNGSNDIKPFSGHFDGKGHTISGIRITKDDGGFKYSYQGVFGYIRNATVKNVKLTDTRITAAGHTGGIAGFNSASTIENCHVTNTVTIQSNGYSDISFGGIAGELHDYNSIDPCVRGCTSAATVSGNSDVGGIVGCLYDGSITDCLYLGTSVTGTIFIGAIVGNNVNNTLSNNYHTLIGLGGCEGSDMAGAQLAYEFPTANGAMGNTGSTYGTGDYTGITAYEHGLAYNGKYYSPSPWGGSGTASDPYVIYNTAGMDKLATDVNGGNYYINTYFVLGNDIAYDAGVLTLDLDGDGNNDSNYMPVGKDASPFIGNFDGQGHTISGISVNANGMNYIGVFGINDGTVKNLMVSDCLFAGSETIGAIAGLNRGTVENCHVAAGVSVTGNNGVGGVVGDNNGSVLGCTSAATLSAKEYASYFGGIAGGNVGTLTDNLFTGTIGEMPDGSWGIGAITGYNNTEGGTLTNNFHTCSGMGGVGNLNDATNTDQDGAQLAYEFPTANGAMGNTGSTYGTGDYTGITAYEHGLAYNGKYYCPSLWGGSGTAEDPYIIVNTQGMDKLATDVNGGNYYINTYFVLGNDIAYDAGVLTLDLDGDGNNDSNYMPVGNSASSFYGNFDGQGHTISGISVNANGMNRIGVFGRNDGTVKNLTVSGCLFAGNSKVGAIAGLNRGTVENCHVAADVSVTGNNGVGGVVGNNEGFVLGCTSAATLSANKEYARYFGGVAGNNVGTLTDNLFTGPIDKMPDGSWGIGAITGYNNTEYGGTLTNNFHTCSGMGGVGNLNDATNSDQDGAQTAVARSTQPDASIIGEEKKTYGGTGYTGITAYENCLYYNGKYYYFSLWGGSGTEADPYVIYNTAGMDKLANDVNGGKYYQDTYFVLGNDIAYVADALTLDLDGDGENDSNYMPVGNDGSSFMGNFDGQGHTISGIRVNANEMNRIGVFGINDGTVKNLTVSGCLFAGNRKVGAIAGLNRGTVENCHVAAYVSVIGNFGVGGVVGENEGFVLGCTSAATLSAKEYAGYFGGIAGSNTGTLTDNLFTGTIDEMPDGSWGIGAITGNNDTELGGTLTNNFHTCSGMGGVGNSNDATNTDQADAQFAMARSTQPDASIIGEEKKTYGGTEYTGITAYENGLYYNGNYYYKHEDVFMTIDLTGDATASAPITLWGLIERTLYGVYVDYDNYTIDLNLDGEGDLQLVPDMDNGVIRISKLTGAANLTTNSLFELIEDGSCPYNGLVIKIDNSYQTEKVRPIFGIYDSGKDGMDFYNSINISGNDGKQFDVMLKGRTFKKDGKWQTIVLPFDVDLTDPNSPLYGITYRTVTAANIENGTTLNLTFAENSNGDENTLLAGKPYIIKWDKAADYQGNESQYDITDPVFPNVTIQYVGGDFWNDTYNFTVAFLGTYNGWTNLTSYFADVSESGLNKPMDVVLLGGDNKLHYAASDASLGACRAIFLVDPAAVTTADPAAHLTNYVMNLGNGEKLTGTFGDVMPGDANGDGVVTISDAVAIVNYILGKAPAGFNEAAADVNGDGKVTITDAVRVVNMIAAQQ